jgi:hypothetical protein
MVAHLERRLWPRRPRSSGKCARGAQACDQGTGRPVLSRRASLGREGRCRRSLANVERWLAVVSGGAAPRVDPGRVLRSQSYCVPLVLAAAIGVVVSVAARGFLELVAGARVARGGRDHWRRDRSPAGRVGRLAGGGCQSSGRLNRLSFRGVVLAALASVGSGWRSIRRLR